VCLQTIPALKKSTAVYAGGEFLSSAHKAFDHFSLSYAINPDGRFDWSGVSLFDFLGLVRHFSHVGYYSYFSKVYTQSKNKTAFYYDFAAAPLKTRQQLFWSIAKLFFISLAKLFWKY
jgi:hypothetical protein